MCVYGCYTYSKCPHDTELFEISRCEFQAELIDLLAEGIDRSDVRVQVQDLECEKVTEIEILGETYGACDACLMDMLEERAGEMAK
jgi:hypothetical protein